MLSTQRLIAARALAKVSSVTHNSTLTSGRLRHGLHVWVGCDGRGPKLRRKVFAHGDAVWRPCNNRKASERERVLWRSSHEVDAVEFVAGNATKKSTREAKKSFGNERENQESEGRLCPLVIPIRKCLVDQKGTKGPGTIRLSKDLCCCISTTNQPLSGNNPPQQQPALPRFSRPLLGFHQSRLQIHVTLIVLGNPPSFRLHIVRLCPPPPPTALDGAPAPRLQIP